VSITALVLIIIAALAHSTWNLLAKRAADCRHLMWFVCIGASILLLPAAIWVLGDDWPKLGPKAAVFLLATGLLHVLYFEALQRGYRAGDLSVVYPLARGTGPLFSFGGAILVLHERPSVVAFGGALLVVCGILLLSGGARIFNRNNNNSSGGHAGNFSGHSGRAGIFWGTMTGLTIACYTIVDGYSVKVLLLSPILVDFAENLFRTIVFSYRGWRERATLPEEFARCWKEALGIAVLTPMAYILVLFAMRIAPVSHIAPAREMSMMIGAYFGTKLLHEGNAKQRIFASLLIASGVAGLVLG
jgi:drug/metabolite transporter (DMT)-like permease